MNHPRIVKNLPRSSEVALHHAKPSTHQSKVTTCFEHLFHELIIPEGHDKTHDYLMVEPEFIMSDGGKPDSTIQVSIGAEQCDSEDVFGALFHESKPNGLKGKRKEEDGRWVPCNKLYIQQPSKVQAAGEQLIKRMEDDVNWEIVRRTHWNGVYGSSGIGEWFALFRRPLEDGIIYRIHRNPGNPTLQEELVPEFPGIGRMYVTSFWNRIEEGGGDFFNTAYSSAGEDIVDQAMYHEIAFNEMNQMNN